MNMIYRYIESLMDLPFWIGFPIYCFSLFIPMVLVVVSFYLLVVNNSLWFLLLPVVIWVACAISWWVKNKDK